MRFDVIIVGGDFFAERIGLTVLAAGQSCCLICKGPILGDGGRSFSNAGGVLLLGDSAVSAEWAEDGSVAAIHTANLGDERLVAGLYILAPGRFFTNGLVADMVSVREPLFGSDVQYDPDRSRWCVDDFFAPQPFESFGVLVDAEQHVLKAGKPVANLLAAGTILAGGVNNVDEICRKAI